MNDTHFDDPVAAYENLAAHYSELSRRRSAYLRSVEDVILSRLPANPGSLLDIGAGDGSRALRIAHESAIERIVLVEPSKEMTLSGTPLDDAEIRLIRAEDLAHACAQTVGTAALGCPVEQSSRNSDGEHDRAFGPETAEGGCPDAVKSSERFGVVTCLWNVLGHIPTAKKRLLALVAIARLLAQQGKFFLDVNHRYNLRSYGIFPTGARWIYDHLFRSERNGDVIAKWAVGETSISTYGHVFTHREIMRLAEAAGLELEERIVIDYDDGRLRRWPALGSLLYVFRRSSRMDSSSAPQTS